MKILTTILLALSCVILFGTVGEAVRDDELVLYLSFDEAKGDYSER